LTGISAATNTHGQIHMQVEVVGYAANPWTDDLTDEGRAGLSRLIEFFRSWGIPDQWADDIRPPVYPGPGVKRLQPTESGHFHHAGWVVNDHGDPGAIADPWNPKEGTVTARSFNGWLVLDEYPTATFTAPGGKTVYCNSREVAVVMEYWARRWHNEIEPIAKSHPDNWARPRERHGTTKAGKWDAIGIHSWRPPGTKVGTGDQSNHRSATGIDINGHLHPYEYTVPPGTYRDGFTQAQRDKVRAIAHAPRDNAGKRIGRSGLDFAKGRRDGMHLEIAPGVTRVQVQQA